MSNVMTAISNDTERISLVKTAAEAASTQAKVTNRLWVAVITTLIIIFQPTTEIAGKEVVDVLFGYGCVEPRYFYAIVYALLCVLMVALAAAHAQQMRADRIAHCLVSSLSAAAASDEPSFSFCLRDLLDVLRYPCLTRVGPLALLISGFYHTPRLEEVACKSGNERRPDKVLHALYVTLKVFAQLVLFAIPLIGLVLAYCLRVAQFADVWVRWILVPWGTFAFFCLSAAGIFDTRLSSKILRSVSNSPKGAG